MGPQEPIRTKRYIMGWGDNWVEAICIVFFDIVQ